jgi:hypothetical protein
MASTLWPQVVDALVTQMRSQTGFRAPTSPGTTGLEVPVFDGTEVALGLEADDRYLVIGWSGDPDNAQDAGESGQVPGPMANVRPKDETGTVECMAVCQVMDASIAAGTVKATRDAAFAVIASVEALCRGAVPGPTLAVPNLQWAFVGGCKPRQFLNEGCVIQVPFTVTYYARL